MKKSDCRPAPRPSAGASHHPHMRHARRAAPNGIDSLFEVRRSGIHGRGVYAARPIPKGTRIVEYLGERITHKQADDRYAAKGQDDGHTFLFVVNTRVVIDAGVDGNDARYINHSCDPNCDTVIEGGRVFIESLRDIEPGEELGYEYGLTWESTDDPAELANYTCRCGAKSCRGTMLAEEPVDAAKLKRAKQRAKKKAAAKRKSKAGSGKAGRPASRERAARRGKTRR
ncbi:MAG: SET domain-containing protein-lysine N-methyltransferase [Steroidobacteraceae bacterium]